MRHVLESQQFTREDLHALFKKADELRNKSEDLLNGKILATLFYEPSTRTRLSFEAAMLRLGGKILTTENAKEFSSAIKGESIKDTVKVISSYADCIVIRHYEEGAAKEAAESSLVPIINGGDGKGQHPTQALLDIYTIYREFGRVDNLKIAMVGDLANGRTVRSLSYLLGKFDGIEITFVSPDNLKMGDDIKEYLERHNVMFHEEDDLNKVISEVDVIYVTRIQKERMSREEYDKANGKYVINQSNFHLIKPNARLMHPLPHVEEISLSHEIEESDKRVAYFRQSENGLYIRMALLNLLMNGKDHTD
ncbi:aspartate carbamoyltransferase [Candidatus Pacearchaeota archaeon]|nr:aspartate carbamoyltransferase [Candidatus Pacearchaeota archaeon]